jgi:biotin operon repressor
MTDWRNRAIELKKSLSWTETAKTIQTEYFPRDELSIVYNRVRAHVRRNGEIPKTANLADLIKTGKSISDISSKMGVSERVALACIEDMKDEGYCIDLVNGIYKLSHTPHYEPKTIDVDWKGDKIIRFGMLGDTQINSKYTQITYLHEAYDIFEREGIETVYHTGDLDDGEKMRPGHEYEIYTHGSDDHVDEIVKVYPKRKKVKTKFICGNHDAAYIKLAGIDIGEQVQGKRDDMEYLGQSQAFINLTPNCTLELRHPNDGTAYAISYKIQKMIDAMSGGEKPNILAVGHYHKKDDLFYRNVHSIQTGCLQAQTPFMRGRSISAVLGYFIIEIHVDDAGQIARLKPEFFPFYKAIPEDYKNWR